MSAFWNRLITGTLAALGASALLAEGLREYPLPLAGSWNTEAWGPGLMTNLVDQGHHVLITFTDPSFRAEFATFSKNEKQKAAQVQKAADAMAQYYRPGLEYARAHRLPIAIRGWNWAANVTAFQERRISLGGEIIPDDQRANVLIGGKIEKQTDPFGPVEAWRDWGRFWFGNALMKELQAIYPDPPLVIFLNNNEAGELHGLEGIEKQDRFVSKYGTNQAGWAFLATAVREGYDERYAALFAAAKEALVAPAWKTNVRFVAYNTLAGTAYIGQGGPKDGLGFDPERGWTQWRRYDGSMPELYDNDWQPGKGDSTPNGMQAEAGNLYAMQARVFAERPGFLWTTIFWDGGVMSDVFRGRRATSKPFRYASSGQRWSFERYEGWVQFCLWATRPRLGFEFRGGEPLDAVHRGTWLALLNSVDRPWTNAVLKEFWQAGELVANTNEAPWANEIPEDAPAWVKSLDRWYILTCDANPPRESWTAQTRLAVFAEALVLGRAPARRWLVYAHAPLGGVSDAGILVPGYGTVRLPSVPRSGSFYLLTESDRTLKPVLSGGPEELSLSVVTDPKAGWPVSKWFRPGQAVPFKVKVALAPGRALTGIAWSFGDGATQEVGTVDGTAHVFAKPGIYRVTASGLVGKETAVRDQAVVYVGEAPAESVAYDLPLDEAPAWEGPWEGAGEDGQALATYRFGPNRGSGPPAVLAGGRFVEDPERGAVYEITEDGGGIWMKRDKQTVMTGRQGASNRTVSLWFKAETVAPRQVLFASGIGPVGMNLYLDKGQLYAGSWATADGVYGDQDPIYGYKWKGDWIRTGPIETGRWYQATWVLKDGANKVEPDRQVLYLNGREVGRAPGASLPVEYVPPRVGRGRIGGESLRPLTRFHDQEEQDKLKPNARIPVMPAFRGRFDDFLFINAAVPPERIEKGAP